METDKGGEELRAKLQCPLFWGFVQWRALFLDRHFNYIVRQKERMGVMM